MYTSFLNVWALSDGMIQTGMFCGLICILSVFYIPALKILNLIKRYVLFQCVFIFSIYLVSQWWHGVPLYNRQTFEAYSASHQKKKWPVYNTLIHHCYQVKC